MEKYNKELLDQLYNENIFLRNKAVILHGGKGDTYLKNARNDDRMSLVLLIRMSDDICMQIEECIKELQEIEPALYYYPRHDFHITVLDILRGEKGRTIPETIDRYTSCIKECAKEVTPFHIAFDGLTASDNAIMVRGYYEDSLQNFRQLLRKNLRKQGLLLEERYETISAHITIARAYTGFDNPRSLVEFVEQEHPIGEMEVNAMELSFHNWYDSRKEVLNTISLSIK